MAAALGGIVQGLTLVGVLAIGVDATAAGRLDGILLAGVALVAFAAFEATLPLGEAARRMAACAGAAEPDRGGARRDARGHRSGQARRAPGDGHAGGRRPDGGPARLAGAVLEDVSLTVAPGDRVAIVGPSGAGKTSLARALVRFVDPVQGTVSLGGVDVRRARQTDVRHAIRLVSQEAHLFTTSLRQNVALGRPDASEEQLAAALERAGLGGWLATLPLGLDTMLGEEGTAVSGGQRRRIALARGLVADSTHLVLDEPTAHLDADGARELLHALATDRDDPRGIVVIAHSYAGLEAFGEIVVLDGGRVVERGTHAELLAAGGLFAALVAAG